MKTPGWLSFVGRWLLWMLLALLCLQMFFAGRIALMAWVDPQSTAFMRSEAWRRMNDPGSTPQRPWAQQWVNADRISPHLKRAVIASEDDGFASHPGVDWAAIESAWARNQKREALAQKRGSDNPVKVVGGSTITQQLAKNLLLSGERLLPRKAQELVLAFMLETFLTKQRILEIYLNSVEWGEGVFGAEAAARHYFRKSAARLNDWEAARLAVMLPRPRYFEQRAQSAYLASRAETIMARMGDVVLP